jgi:Ca2+-binding RTX toxin-like protein
VTAAGTETITLSDASTASGLAEVESYMLAAGSQSFTLGASGQNVTLDSTGSSGSVAISTGTLTSVTGTLDDGTGNDTIALTLATTGVNISSADTTDVDSIVLASGVSATMTIAQHALITSAASANTVTLSDAGTVTGNAAVESYNLAAGSNNFTTDTVGQTVVGNTGVDTIIGSSGNDVIIGGDGDDFLIGGTGVDVLTGGTGTDKFAFGTADTRATSYQDINLSSTFNNGDQFNGDFDIIRDFATGVDKVDIDDIVTFYSLSDSNLYVNDTNALEAMKNLPDDLALLIRGEFDEVFNKFTCDFDSGSDTLLHFNVGGTDRGLVLDNSILTSTNDFI